MRFAALYVVFILLGQDVFAQRAKTLSFYYPLSEEFDFSRSIQQTTHPSFAYLDKDIGYSIGPFPLTIGISYQRAINPLHAINLRYEPFFIFRYGNYDHVNGLSVGRTNWVISLEYERLIKTNIAQRQFLSLIGGLKYRQGLDRYYVPRPVLFGLPYRKLRDLGATAGIRWKYFAKWNLVLSADVRLTQWLFIYYHHFNPSTTTYKLPRSAFEMRFGIGYCFGRKLDLKPKPKAG